MAINLVTEWQMLGKGFENSKIATSQFYFVD